MTMAYQAWVTALSGFLPETLANTTTEQPFINGSRYNLVIDRAIEYAEMRIYREPDFDFLAARESMTSTCTPGTRSIQKPLNMIVAEEINLILPAGAQPDAPGSTRVPLDRPSSVFINTVWPSIAYTAQPRHIAQTVDTTFILGPNPDQAYVLEFYGKYRPTPLSATNPNTYLTLWMPDLFLAASMIFFSMYQKKIGVVASVGPNEGTTWESYYTTLKAGVALEEARKKFQSAGWSPDPPTTVATPARQ